jgi:recombination protein RecT
MADNTKNLITQATEAKVTAPKQTGIKAMIKMYEKEIAKALPSILTPERFMRMAITATTKTPKLAQCEPKSFICAMLEAAQLGLEPNTPLGQAYLIPYGKQCQFQIGYKGLIDLAHRSGEVKSIEAHEVYENDFFEFEFGLEPKLVHKPAIKDRGAVIWYYAVYHLVNGGYGFEVMSRDDVEQHARKYSKAFSNSPWQTDFDAMAKKTVLKKALKYAPLKSEFARGVSTDERIGTVNFDDGEATQLFDDSNVVDEAENIVADDNK